MKMHRTMWLQVILLAALNCVSVSAFNITNILEKLGDYSMFNRLLSETHIANEINKKQAITVLALNDASIQSLISGNLPLKEVADILRYHVLLQYFGTDQLQSITNGTTLVTTLYQSTGRAAGNLGSVNITVQKTGTVGIGEPKPATNLTSTVLKSLVEIPYNISVLQVSNVLLPIGIEAPMPSPVPSPSPSPYPAPTPALTPAPATVSSPELSASGSAASPKTSKTVVGAPGSASEQSNEAPYMECGQILSAALCVAAWLLVI